MVPTYAAEALAGLFAKNWSEFLEVARECYEAFVLFSFVQLLLAYLSLSAPEGAIKVAFDLNQAGAAGSSCTRAGMDMSGGPILKDPVGAGRAHGALLFPGAFQWDPSFCVER